MYIYIIYVYIYIYHIYIIYGIYNIRCIYIYISPVKIHVIDGCVNKERLQQDSANQQGGGVLAIPPFKATVQWVMEGVEYGIFLQNSIRMYPINTGGLSIVLYILNHDQNNRSMDVPAKIDSQTFRMI